MSRSSVLILTLIISLFLISQNMAFSANTSGINATVSEQSQGVRVDSISSSGRASRFGLQQGDIVLEIEGQEVEDSDSFFNLMNDVPRGSAVSIKVIRDNDETTVGRTSVMGMGGRMGGGGMGGRMGGGRNQNRLLVAANDKDGNGWLDKDERNAIRGSSGTARSTVSYGHTEKPEDVNWFSEEQDLYDLGTLRTIFLEFENGDWEQELEYFYHTDVEVPVTMTVDGKVYENVGIRFRGNTSYSMVSTGWKRPLNISVDFINDDQRLYGYRTLNLMNSVSDPTFLRQVLYSYIARQYIPALKANYVRLVINNEFWGIYVNYQQFNTDFIKDFFDTRKGARWKVSQMSNGGGLSYLGDNIASYQNVYEIKSDDDPNSWTALANLCKVLNQTPSSELVEALEPIMNIDETLKFLALDKALINNDGYWTRASDYLIYMDKKGIFNIFPYDTSETLSTSEGGGRGGFGGFGGGGGGYRLEPLTGAYDSNKPLLSRLLAVPELKQKYFGYIRDIAENWLEWENILPVAEQCHSLIANDVELDPRKLGTTANFNSALSESGSDLKSFFTERQRYLLGLSDISQAPLPNN